MILFLAACAHTLGVPSVQYAAEPLPIPIVSTSIDPRWYLPMDVDGEPWIWFFDTGYSNTTCDDDFVGTHGFPTVGSSSVKGELGRLLTGKAALPRFTLGGHTIDGLVCQVRDLNATSSIRDPDEVRIAGVLGMDVLRPFLVDVDPVAGEVLLERPPAQPDQDPANAVPLRREMVFGTRAKLPIDVEGERVWIVVDTGASGTHLDGRAAGLEPVRVKRGVMVRGSGSGGADLRNLEFFEAVVQLGGIEVPATELVGRRGRSGLLGLNVLGHLHARYDLGRGLAWFEPVRPREVPPWSAWRAAYTSAPGSVMWTRSDPPPI